MGQQKSSQSYKNILTNSGIVLLVGVFGLLATGCSLGGSNNTAAPKQVKVRIWRVNQDVDPIRDIMDQFMSDNPNIKVTYQKNKLDNYEFNSLKSLAGRLGPDIWSIPNDWIGDYQDQIQPLPDNFFITDQNKNPGKPVDYVKKLYPAGILEQIISTDGTKVYGMPTNVDTLQLYYNPDLFSTASSEFVNSKGDNAPDSVIDPVTSLLAKPPATWDNLVEQAKYITKRNGPTVTRGTIALGTADNIPNAEDVLQLLMLQNGAKIISDDHKSPLFHVAQGTPSGGQVRPGEKALDFFASFSNPSKSTYSWNPSMPQALDAFAQGKVAMVIGYTDFAKQLAIKYPDFSYQVAAIPQISAAQSPVNFIKFSVETVTKTADSANAAFAFLKQYTDSNTAGSLAQERGIYSPYIASFDLSVFQEKQITTGKAIYKLNHNQFDGVFRQMIIDVSQNGISTGDAIKGGADKIDELISPPIASPTPSTK